jgi:hypothetical protein
MVRCQPRRGRTPTPPWSDARPAVVGCQAPPALAISSTSSTGGQRDQRPSVTMASRCWPSGARLLLLHHHRNPSTGHYSPPRAAPIHGHFATRPATIGTRSEAATATPPPSRSHTFSGRYATPTRPRSPPVQRPLRPLCAPLPLAPPPATTSAIPAMTSLAPSTTSPAPSTTSPAPVTAGPAPGDGRHSLWTTTGRSRPAGPSRPPSRLRAGYPTQPANNGST